MIKNLKYNPCMQLYNCRSIYNYACGGSNGSREHALIAGHVNFEISAANRTDHRSASNIGADGSVNLKLAAATVSAGNVPPTNPTATPMSWGAY